MGGFFAGKKLLRDIGHETEGNKFAPALVDRLGLLFLHIRLFVLVGVCHLGSKQQDKPGEIKAHQEYGDHAEAAVHLAVCHHAGDVDHAEKTV